jgi:hypothetical protein
MGIGQFEYIMSDEWPGYFSAIFFKSSFTIDSLPYLSRSAYYTWINQTKMKTTILCAMPPLEIKIRRMYRSINGPADALHIVIRFSQF